MQRDLYVKPAAQFNLGQGMLLQLLQLYFVSESGDLGFTNTERFY